MDLNDSVVPGMSDKPIRSRSDTRGWAIAVVLVGLVGFGALLGGIVGYLIGRAVG